MRQPVTATDLGSVNSSVPPPGFVTSPVSTAASVPAADTPTARQPNGGEPPRGRRAKLLAAGGAVAVAAALTLGLLSLFGGGGLDPVARAAALSSSTPGYRMKLSMTITAPGLTAPITASGSGVVDVRDRAASLVLALDLSQVPQAAQQLGTSSLRIGMIMSAGSVYLRLPTAMAQQIPGLGSRPWLKVDVGKLPGVPGLSSLGADPALSDPSRMLDYLKAISDGVVSEGQQQLDGVPTTRYHATIDPSRLPDVVPASDRPALQQAVSGLEQATGGQGIPVDVWIDAAHLVRRMEMSIGAAGVPGTGIQETAIADFTDYGPQAPPRPPSAGQVQDLTGLLQHSA